MAKKKKTETNINNHILDVFGNSKLKINPNDLEEMTKTAMESLSPEDNEEFQLMYALALRQVTPDDYAQFYVMYQAAQSLTDNALFDSEDEDEDDTPFPFAGVGFGRNRCNVTEYKPLKDASNHTLVLKIQMKGVSKPPMWREVEIPADFNFLKLHEVIQEVTGLDDCHLWQFNVNAYDPTLQIGLGGLGDNPFSQGLDEVTHEAEETPLTQFLQKKGDKLEYVYDFGDDWIFIIEVKNILDKKSDYPVCRKYKSELNAIDDFGGIWSYTQARADLENWGKLTKKQKKERLNEVGFDNEDDYIEFLNENRFSLDDINDSLMAF